MLLPDTFNDHFHPETLRAAVDVLQTLGFEVTIPRAPLCCGRPLYDFGLLAQAKDHLAQSMSILADDIRQGTPVVGLEPGCVSLFRDELVGLFPRSEQAHRLKTQTLTFAELLDRVPDRVSRYRLERRAVVHGHCHHKAIMQMDADRRLLDRLRIRHDVLDSGCCGMAGAFGFEAAHYDTSMAIGERVLLPAVRAVPADTLVIADGFSCREQIAHGTPRRALHLAEVVQLATTTGPQGPSGDLPERVQRADHAREQLSTRELTGMGLTLAGVALGWWAARRARGPSQTALRLPHGGRHAS